jgi:hypothetical protein
MADNRRGVRRSRSRIADYAWSSVSGLLSNVKTLCIIFGIAAGLGLVLIITTSGLGGVAEVTLQSIGAALFTAGLIAFPLAILGHSELTNAARSDLRQLRETSADKILEERLSRQHIESLRDDTFGKPVIEHYRLRITLHEEAAPARTAPVITLVHEREYTAINRDAVTTLIDVLHHTTGPLNYRQGGRVLGFTYVRLNVDDGQDALEWNPEFGSEWTRSPEGRSIRSWRGCDVSIGREVKMPNVFSFRAEGLRMGPGSRLHAKVVSESEVATTSSEPFVVFLPTMELEVIVVCSRDMDTGLFPLHAVQAGGLAARSRVPLRGNMQEITWTWERALFAGQGVILRWARPYEEEGPADLNREFTPYSCRRLQQTPFAGQAVRLYALNALTSRNVGRLRRHKLRRDVGWIRCRTPVKDAGPVAPRDCQRFVSFSLMGAACGKGPSARDGAQFLVCEQDLRQHEQPAAGPG